MIRRDMESTSVDCPSEDASSSCQTLHERKRTINASKSRCASARLKLRSLCKDMHAHSASSPHKRWKLIETSLPSATSLEASTFSIFAPLPVPSSIPSPKLPVVPSLKSSRKLSASNHHRSFPLKSIISLTHILHILTLLLPVAVLCADPSPSGMIRIPVTVRTTSTNKGEIRKAGETTGALNLVSGALQNIKTMMYEHAHTIYYIYAYVGTPPQPLKVLLDTGSYSTWVRSPQCRSFPSCVLAPTFDSLRSSTFAPTGLTSPTIRYDKTEVEGVIGRDYFSIGEASTMAVPRHTFTLATSVVGVNGGDIDGVVGMSLQPTVVANNTFSMFFQSLQSSGVLNDPYFSVMVDTEFDSGEVIFGGYDSLDFADPTSSPIWIPTVDSTYTVSRSHPLTFVESGSWALPLVSISTSLPDSIPLLRYPTTATNRTAAIIDTGSNLASIPASLFRALADVLGGTDDGAGGFWVSCDRRRIDGGPTVWFEFANGESIAVTPIEYIRMLPIFENVQPVTSPAPGSDSRNVTATFVDRCFLNFRASEEDKNYVILGNSVTKRFVTIFDYERRRVGFALARGRTPDAFNVSSLSAPAPKLSTTLQSSISATIMLVAATTTPTVSETSNKSGGGVVTMAQASQGSKSDGFRMTRDIFGVWLVGGVLAMMV
ncbi:aspartic peptidase domain-containing protein [Chytridium lagenaria]|nr:aspartic peptidase domain-containing protein [Chytridium lagenaria]